MYEANAVIIEILYSIYDC